MQGKFTGPDLEERDNCDEGERDVQMINGAVSVNSV